MSDTQWIHCTIRTSVSSLDAKNKKSPSRIPMNIMRQNIISLFSDICALDAEICTILDGFFGKGRVKRIVDTYTSSLTGPKTKRVTFVFPKNSIFLHDVKITEGKHVIRAIGKEKSVGDCDMLSNFLLEVIITHVPATDIDELLTAHPTWFCGKIVDSSTSNVKRATD